MICKLQIFKWVCASTVLERQFTCWGLFQAEPTYRNPGLRRHGLWFQCIWALQKCRKPWRHQLLILPARNNCNNIVSYSLMELARCLAFHTQVDLAHHCNKQRDIKSVGPHERLCREPHELVVYRQVFFHILLSDSARIGHQGLLQLHPMSAMSFLLIEMWLS